MRGVEGSFGLRRAHSPVDESGRRTVYFDHIRGKTTAVYENTTATDGYVSRRTLETLTTLPSRAQTAILRTLAALGPLDECCGDSILSTLLAFAALDAVRDVNQKSLQTAAESIRQANGSDIDIDLLRTIAEAPTDFHGPLLRLLLVARPIGSLSAMSFFLRIWDEVQSHRTRTLWCGDIERIARALALGPDFDEIVLRFLASERNDRAAVMDREVQLKIDGADVR